MAETKMISIDFSDGVKDKAPEDTSEDPPKGTHYNYLRVLKKDDPKRVKWMTVLGSFIKEETSLKADDCQYILDDLPKNYTLLEHNKWLPEGKKPRTDMYLYGHPGGGRYRSPNEFMPHLLWLAKDKDHVVANCLCRFCPGEKVVQTRKHTPRKEVKKVEEKKKETRLPRTRTAAVALGKTEQSQSGRRTRPVYTGMSEMGKTQMQKAKDDMFRDLNPHAPVFRIGEIVLKDGQECIVAESRANDSMTTVASALAHHSYTLLLLEEPFERFERVLHKEISPFLASLKPHASSDAPVLKSASPIAKYNLQSNRDLLNEHPGPRYIGWYIGPEKVYHNDLVRVVPQRDNDSEYVMSINEIILDVKAKTVKVRGDLFELVPGVFDETADLLEQSHQQATTSDEKRKIPDNLALIVKVSEKTAKFLNPADALTVLPMADVLGRFYHPRAFPGALDANEAVTVVRGRVTKLPEKLVKEVDGIFAEPEKAEVKGVKLGSRTGDDGDDIKDGAEDDNGDVSKVDTEANGTNQDLTTGDKSLQTEEGASTLFNDSVLDPALNDDNDSAPAVNETGKDVLDTTMADDNKTTAAATNDEVISGINASLFKHVEDDEPTPPTTTSASEFTNTIPGINSYVPTPFGAIGAGAS